MIDGVFNAATCQTFRSEILSLRDQSLLHLNSTHLVKGDSTRLLPKHGIYEAEVADKVRPVGLSYINCPSLQISGRCRPFQGNHLCRLAACNWAIRMHMLTGVNHVGWLCRPSKAQRLSSQLSRGTEHC